eukprot:m.134278 g.134278  ORF g.134278 m.134278 type:complete len:53 (-) comp14690_c0_seq7:2020-2178(-)
MVMLQTTILFLNRVMHSILWQKTACLGVRLDICTGFVCLKAWSSRKMLRVIA